MFIMSGKKASILQEVKNGTYYNSYFLSGTNEYESGEIVQHLKAAVLTPGFESFDLEQFDAAVSSFDMGELERAYHTPPMASGKRLTVLASVNRLADAEKKTLLSLLESPSETGILIMISESGAKTKSGFYQKLRALSRSEDLRNPRTYPLLKWMKEYVKKYRCGIDDNAAQTIVEFLGKDQLSLAGEMEKMVTYVGSKGRITRDDALAVLTSNMVNNVFDLTSAIGARKKREALSILTYLLDWGEVPEMVLGVLRTFFIRLRGFLFYRQQGLMKKDIAKKMGVMYFIVNNELGFTRNFTEGELKQRLRLLCDAEVRIKSGEEAELILTDLVYNLI